MRVSEDLKDTFDCLHCLCASVTVKRKHSFSRNFVTIHFHIVLVLLFEARHIRGSDGHFRWMLCKFMLIVHNSSKFHDHFKEKGSEKSLIYVCLPIITKMLCYIGKPPLFLFGSSCVSVDPFSFVCNLNYTRIIRN